MSLPHTFPEQATPLDVIITIIVTASDRLTSILQPVKDEPDDDRAEDEESDLYSRLSPTKPFTPLCPLDRYVIHKKRGSEVRGRGSVENRFILTPDP